MRHTAVQDSNAISYLTNSVPVGTVRAFHYILATFQINIISCCTGRGTGNPRFVELLGGSENNLPKGLKVKV